MRRWRGHGRRRTAAEALDASADAVDEIVVLLGAGVGLGQARSFLGSHARRMLDPPDADADADADAAPDRASTVVGAVLTVCRVSGAPVAGALARQAGVLRDLAQAAREVELAAAGPVATARIVGLLPLGGVVVAVLLGFDVLGAVTGSLAGAASVLVGAALAALGALWSRRIVRAARPRFEEPGLLHELVLVAVSGGMGADAAVRLARDSHPDGARSDEIDDVERLLAVGRRSGAALRPLLEAQAALRRRRSSAAARMSSERLPAALLLPLGVCSLPSFLLLGVVPALLAVVSSTVL